MNGKCHQWEAMARAKLSEGLLGDLVYGIQASRAVRSLARKQAAGTVLEEPR